MYAAFLLLLFSICLKTFLMVFVDHGCAYLCIGTIMPDILFDCSRVVC